MPPLDLPGWYYSKKEGEDKDVFTSLWLRLYIDQRFIWSVKRHKEESLFLTKRKCLQGSVFNPQEVRAVYNLSKDDILPFFVLKKEVDLLEANPNVAKE